MVVVQFTHNPSSLLPGWASHVYTKCACAVQFSESGHPAPRLVWLCLQRSVHRETVSTQPAPRLSLPCLHQMCMRCAVIRVGLAQLANLKKLCATETQCQPTLFPGWAGPAICLHPIRSNHPSSVRPPCSKVGLKLHSLNSGSTAVVWPNMLMKEKYYKYKEKL